MSYTAVQEAGAEARIQSDLDAIVQAVRDAASSDDLLGVVLLGGYARGDGTAVRLPDGSWRGFNDYDLLLVFRSEPRSRSDYQHLSKKLARQCEIDFVDLGIATLKDLSAAEPTLFWVELSQAQRVLWIRPGESWSLPEYNIEDLDPEEGARLMVNRGMALLWGFLKLWAAAPGKNNPESGTSALRFAIVAAHKAILSAGDAYLIQAGRYCIQGRDRMKSLTGDQELQTRFPELLPAYRAAVEFRFNPVWPATGEAGPLVFKARQVHQAVFAFVEASLGLSADWSLHARQLKRRRFAQGLRRPLRFLRAAWHRQLLDPENYFRARLPILLYLRSSGEPWDVVPAWRTQAQALVARWHP